MGAKPSNYAYVATLLHTASKLIIGRSKVQLLLGPVGFCLNMPTVIIERQMPHFIHLAG